MNKVLGYKSETAPKGVPANFEVFPLKDLYVQILCEDEKGLFVANNKPFLEMVNDRFFADNLRCVEVRNDGYNTTSISLVLYSECQDFAITKYMAQTHNMKGEKVGGLSVNDFNCFRGVSLTLFSVYYGDDNKAGF